MSFLVDIIPARYRKLVYGCLAVAASTVAVLGQVGVLSASGADQIGAVIAAIVAALAHANTEG